MSDLFEDVLDEHQSNGDLIITSEIEKKEWQCIECGTVDESKVRPRKCPHCNTVNSDLDGFQNVMIRREACGWFK